MSLKPWEQLSEESLVQYKVFHVRKVRRRSPRTGANHGLFILDTVDWVNVVAFTEQQDLILVRQYRHGTCEFTLEIPGGIVHGDEDLELAARRELREETGYQAAQLSGIGGFYGTPGFSTEYLHVFVATGLSQVGQELDETEDITPVSLSVDAVRAMVRGEGLADSERIRDAKTLAALALFFARGFRS